MGRLPHPAWLLETKEKAPITECLLCLTVAGPHAYAEVRAVLSCVNPAGVHAGAPGGCRYPLASYTRIVPQKSTIRVWSFYKFY